MGLDMWPMNGYGYATERIVESLRRLGYHVEYMDARADVHFHFDQPQHFEKPRDDIFSIMYHPWESTLLLPGWADIMNTADEVWTPSPLIADWYQRHNNITKPVYVFEHGVDKIWKPVHREHSGEFKFLHIGGEASRKGLSEAMQGRRLAFSKKNVSITVKIISNGWSGVWMPRVNVRNDKVSVEELVEMFHEHHAYIYPSYGEGFGLTPLQAMATGMPTLTVGEWAPYRNFMDPQLDLPADLVKSPWPILHPGAMLKPRLSGIIEAMQYVVENYDECVKNSMEQTDKIFEHYDWDRLTAEAFGDLELRLK